MSFIEKYKSILFFLLGALSVACFIVIALTMVEEFPACRASGVYDLTSSGVSGQECVCLGKEINLTRSHDYPQASDTVAASLCIGIQKKIVFGEYVVEPPGL